MTPIDTAGPIESQNVCTGCTSDAKTEFLVLCSGMNGLHQHKLNQTHSNTPISLPGSLPLQKSKLSVLLDYSHSDLPGLRGNKFQHNLPSHLKPVLNHSLNEPHLVKVAIYTKAVNPYIVIYDSTKKYAKPVAYLKLANYTVIPGNGQSGSSDEDCSFRVLPNRHEDIDNASVITFRAKSTDKRDDLVKYLNSLCGSHSLKSDPLHGYVPGSSVLPTLVEEDDETFADETFNITTPPVSREGRRRSSLNSLGIRLRFDAKAVGRARS